MSTSSVDLSYFHPVTRKWFLRRFENPTEAQQDGWPSIAKKQDTLIAAPTGSGKTLAAFLVCIDQLLRQWLEGKLFDGVQVVYISPLKALSNDIHRNLDQPLAEICELAVEEGYTAPLIRAMVRTGDTTASDRQKMLRKPPHILVTTPESLYLLLTSEKGRNILIPTKTLIVDEIHALARDKRGSHLALSMARLDALCTDKPVRIGLSATQRPLNDIANFLVGVEITENQKPTQRSCNIVDRGHIRDLDIAVTVPQTQLSAVCSHEQWAEIYEILEARILTHRSTLVFVNTRRMAERVAHHLTEKLGDGVVASHHGSLSKEIRLSAEQRLKAGELRVIVATASLEMGIDIGYIDQVCQIGSPRCIATFLQRVGRSGHSIGALPKGRLFPLTRDELLECLALIRSVHQGILDQIEIPQQPLDILSQQIVASIAAKEMEEHQLYDLCRTAWPYRNLEKNTFGKIVALLSEGFAPGMKRGLHLHRDQIQGQLRPRRGARLTALTSGGAIPDTAEFRVVTEEDRTFVGKLDEDFAIESTAGDIFVLGNTSWRVRYVRNGEVVVNDAQGAPPNIPFWFGEAPGRTIELSTEISNLRDEISQRAMPANAEDTKPTDILPLIEEETDQNGLNVEAIKWVVNHCGANAWAAEQAVSYITAQRKAIGVVPTGKQIVYERFFDESGGMQLVIHAPLGARINRAWGLALRKRFCRSFDFELQASADDNGVVLSLGPQHSFPIVDLFKMLTSKNGQYLLEQALLAAPMFQTRWRWNITRALAILRQTGGKRVPPHLQRFRSDDLLAATFPETVGCLENHSGDIEVPDHPIVQQTMDDCLHEAMDLVRWLEILQEIETGKVELIARDTREPSPFALELINANPYAFLDGAALEERRTRAVTGRRYNVGEDVDDISKLDSAAIAQVCQEAWPVVRDADELHDALMSLITLTPEEGANWQQWFDQLVSQGRGTIVQHPNRTPLWIATERWPVVQAGLENVTAQPEFSLPEHLQIEVQKSDAWVELVRGRVQHSGPITTSELADHLGLTCAQVDASLMSLEGQGVVLRGQFIPATSGLDKKDDIGSTQWCERGLLARIHRLTLTGLRKRIQPVSPEDYMRFLIRHHCMLPGYERQGEPGVRLAIAQLQGVNLPAGAWEGSLLESRVANYDPNWLDHLSLSGELCWGRLNSRNWNTGIDKEKKTRRTTKLNRSIPISLMLREDLDWLNSEETDQDFSKLDSNCQIVLELLQNKGALFFVELKRHSQLLPGHLEEALRQLAALGLVTSDAYAAVRLIVNPKKSSSSRHRSRNTKKSPAGRWSIFPGLLEPPSDNHLIEKWCRQLLLRYGVVFRDCLTREYAAPPWSELVHCFRHLERRGEVCGGRFISGTSGEQYTTEHYATRLREVRDMQPNDDWIVISAADVLNLSGIVLPGERIATSHRNSIILQNGQIVAAGLTDGVKFYCERPITVQNEMRRALLQGRKTTDQDSANLNKRWIKRFGSTSQAN